MSALARETFVSRLPPTPVRAFCTWTLHGELRGCIGSLDPVPMSDVPKLAVDAAIRDSRFRPMKLGELHQASLEITWLTEPLARRNLYDWTLGKDGIVLVSRGRRATFLPQVPVEHGWSKAETVARLAQKGGFALDGGVQLLAF